MSETTVWSARQVVRDVLVAIQLYTRIPVTGRVGAWLGFQPDTLHRAAAHLPLVGWLVGSLAGGIAWLVNLAWGPPVVAVAGTAATVLLTGAFHEDGLADSADALGGPVGRPRALEIMTDSRLGTYGVVALVLVLGAKFALLAQAAAVSASTVVVVLVTAHVISRLCPLAVMTALPYIGASTGKAKPMAERATRTTQVIAACWSAPALVLAAIAFGPLRAGLVVLLTVVVTAGVIRLLRRRLGGFTGDTLGATQQLTELTLLAVLCAASG